MVIPLSTSIVVGISLSPLFRDRRDKFYLYHAISLIVAIYRIISAKEACSTPDRLPQP